MAAAEGAHNGPARHAPRLREAIDPWPLIGRARELAGIVTRLRDPTVRLVTLTGPPGVGKTRLALAVAEQLQDAFEDGVSIIRLDDVAAPAEVPAAVARSIALSETSATPTESLLVTALRASHRLVVLDTFEHVINAASWLATLLAACPEIKALVTSRAALRVRWEREVAVPPLALEAPGIAEAAPPSSPAAELFIQRAAALGSGFTPAGEDRKIVASICRRLDGLPLAIELAAARCALLSPAAILSRLEDRLALLSDGAPELPPRHRALRAAIDWSHALLPAREQLLFRRLAVFAGGFALEAAEALAAEAGDLGPEPLDHVAALLRHNLLVHSQPVLGATTRLRMLETVNAYALEQLRTAEEESAVRDWHARYYLALAGDASGRLIGPQQVAALAQLDVEHDNLRAALDWALSIGDAEMALTLSASLWRYWQMRGYLREGRQRLERALARGRADASLRAQALHGLAALALAQGDLEAADAALTEAFTIRLEADDRAALAALLTERGNLALRRGDYAAARSHYEESLAHTREAVTLNNLGLALRRLGDAAAARALFEEGLTLARRLGDRRAIALALNNLAADERDAGGYERSRRLHEESLALLEELGNRPGVAGVLSHLAATARRQGDIAAARAFSRRSLVLVRDLGDVNGTAVNLAALAAVAAADGQTEQAARLFGAAESLLRGAGAPALLEASVEFRSVIATVRSALGSAWETARRAGGLLSPEQSIGEALAVAEQEVRGTPAAGSVMPRLAVPLSRREREVLHQLVEGRTNKEMAETLVLSIRTIESHVFNIYAKIGARGRADATAYALRHGLV